MNWIRGYLGSMILALLLAVLTWMWLYSESTATRDLDFDFKPQIGVDLADIRYDVRGAELNNDRIKVTVTGPRGIVETLRPQFPCDPLIEDSRFTADQGSITITLRYEDFRLPLSVRPKILPEVTLHYVKYLTRTVGIDARPTDVEDGPPPGLRVASIRPTPPLIRVRVPATEAAQLTSLLSIEKIRVAGRTSTFHAPGRIRTSIPNVRQAQEFSLEVVLDRALTRWTIKDVPLNLAGPPEIVNRLRFKTASRVDVLVEGPQEFQKEMSAKDLLVYVHTDHLTQNDLKTPPIVLKSFGSEIRNPKLVPLVRVVTIMPEAQPDNRQVEVDSTEN